MLRNHAFGLSTGGDILRHHEQCGASRETQSLCSNFHFKNISVSVAVPPMALRRRGILNGPHSFPEASDFSWGPNVRRSHPQEFLAGISVAGHGGGVRLQEPQSLPVND